MVVGSRKYRYRGEWRKENANHIFKSLLGYLPKINSAVDFGCGLGAWLVALNELGVAEIKGYDGCWVKKDSLEIPKECFAEADFTKKVIVEKRYDLAISIEVAEHLPEENAKLFVETLTEASDIVLFSAAIPYQGGTNHVNEQWQGYWNMLFQQFEYVAVDIRALIWNNPKIRAAYRQNMILYVKKEKVDGINIPEEYIKITDKYLNIVHPVEYITKMENNNIRTIPLLRLYRIGIKRTIKKLITFGMIKEAQRRPPDPWV